MQRIVEAVDIESDKSNEDELIYSPSKTCLAPVTPTNRVIGTVKNDGFLSPRRQIMGGVGTADPVSRTRGIRRRSAC